MSVCFPPPPSFSPFSIVFSPFSTVFSLFSTIFNLFNRFHSFPPFCIGATIRKRWEIQCTVCGIFFFIWHKSRIKPLPNLVWILVCTFKSLIKVLLKIGDVCAFFRPSCAFDAKKKKEKKDNRIGMRCKFQIKWERASFSSLVRKLPE